MLVALVAAGCSDGESATSPTTTSAAAEVTTTTAATATTAVTTPLVADGPPARVEVTSPEDLADRLTVAERAVRDPGTSDAEAALAGATQQLLYRALAGRREWDALVLERVGSDVRSAVAQNLAARRAVIDAAAARPRPPSPTLPAWRIVEPPPAAQLLAWYDEAAARTGVPWSYLAAIHLVETRMGRIDGASPDGAIGPMQFLPSTWAACCTGDPHDAHDAINGAADYLVDRGAPGDMSAALRGYNPSDSYVAAVSAYASVLAADRAAYRGYHGWQVFVGSVAGDVRLPIGYAADVPLDAASYVADHPADRA